MPKLIYWRWTALPPAYLRLVPTGYEAVTELPDALTVLEPHLKAVGLPPTRDAHFRMLWRTWLEWGMQPSGLVLLHPGTLIDALGHSTKGTFSRWRQFCERRTVWVRIPGPLHPPRPEGRTYAHLVIRPAPGP